MAPKKGQQTAKGSGTGKGKARKPKQATQKTPLQRVMIMGPTGKLRLEWRPWS